MRRTTIVIATTTAAAAIVALGLGIANADHIPDIAVFQDRADDDYFCVGDQDCLDIVAGLESPIDVAAQATIAFLANGRVPADALAAGPIAGGLGAPILTTEATTLSPAAVAGIEAAGADLVIVLGGPVAVSAAVVTSLSSQLGLAVVEGNVDTDTRGIIRVAGETRFDTALAVSALLSDLDPHYQPIDGLTAAAEVAAHADRSTSAATADAADSLEGRIPFNVQLGSGEVILLAQLGDLELFASCNFLAAPDPDEYRVDVFARTKGTGGALEGSAGDLDGSPGNTLDNDTPSADRRILAFSAPVNAVRVGNIIDNGFAVSSDLDAILIDGESTVLGINFQGHDCTAIGTATLIPGPSTR